MSNKRDELISRLTSTDIVVRARAYAEAIDGNDDFTSFPDYEWTTLSELFISLAAEIEQMRLKKNRKTL
jgi:hypothetical protein